MSSHTPEKLKPFEFHGVIVHGNTTAKGECPFCQKDKFFVKVATGQWSCKSCTPQGGNVYAFLRQLWEQSYANTTKQDYIEIEKQRNIPWEQLKEDLFAKSIVTNEWLLPAYNVKKALSNLYKIVYTFDSNAGKKRWIVMSTPTCNLHPFGTLQLTKRHTSLFVSEGPWDMSALKAALKKVRLNVSNKRHDSKRHRLTAKPSHNHEGLEEDVPFDVETDAANGHNLDEGFLSPLDKANALVKTADISQSMAKDHGVMGVPGAGTFSPDWLPHFEDRQTMLCYDSDHPKKIAASGQIIKPGWDGMNRVVKLVNESAYEPDSLYKTVWGPNGYDKARPTGFDVRDLLSEKGPVKGLTELLSLQGLVSSPKEEDGDQEDDAPEVIECDSFPKLCSIYERTGLHLTERMRTGFAVALATTISTRLGGSQLWVRIIGPAGCGKSTIAEAISADRKHAYPQSIVTGWHSGYVDHNARTKGGKPKDNSLIPKMRDKIVVIKDADTICSSSSRDRILSELRDIFDGVSRSTYRTGKADNYDDLRIAFLLCGTDHLRTLNRSALGDRFLDCEMMGDGDDGNKIVKKAISNSFENIRRSLSPKEEGQVHGSYRKELKLATVGFLRHWFNKLQTHPHIHDTQEVRDKLEYLANFVSYMRARVHREGDGPAYRPRRELATRLGEQLGKLAYCLALILGKKTIDREVMRIVKQIAIATSTGYVLDIAEALSKVSKGLSTHQLERAVNISETTIRRTIADMQDLKIVKRNNAPNASGIRGRNLHLWTLTPEVATLWSKIGGKV